MRISHEHRLTNNASAQPLNDNAVSLSAFIERWHEMHGKRLTSGEERKVKLDAICIRLGNPLAVHFEKNLCCLSGKTFKRGMESKGKAAA